MSLRTRLTLLVAFCVAAAVVAVSFLAYAVAQDRLVSAVDETLDGRAKFVAGRPFSFGADVAPLSDGEAPDEEPGAFRRGRGSPGLFITNGPGIPSIDVFQVVSADGDIVFAPADQAVSLPVTDADLDVAHGTGSSYFHNATVDDIEYRVLSSPGPGNTVVLTARSLAEVNATLHDLRSVLIVVSAAGIVVAAVVGLVVAHRSLRPVRQLTAAVEHVAATQDLSHTIDVSQRDELGRLAMSFNTMLKALETSRLQQRQLVTDASHELRTPLTSLRTNIELLARDDTMALDDRQQILEDATFEVAELTKIVSELVDLATDLRTHEREREDVRLDEVARAVVARARRRSGLDIRLRTRPAVIAGHHELIERAVANLVDNACKWSDPGGVIDVEVRDGEVTVRDHGPGIAAADLPYVFERFYRSDEARAKPGSGLGLAIVKQIAEAHGGAVRAETCGDGGALITLTLPAIELDAEPAPVIHELRSLAT